MLKTRADQLQGYPTPIGSKKRGAIISVDLSRGVLFHKHFSITLKLAEKNPRNTLFSTYHFKYRSLYAGMK